MVCVPCIFVGLAIVIWCKFLEPYIRPIYEKLCQYYPPLRIVGTQLQLWGTKLEQFGEKIGIRLPQSCPMPKRKTDASKVRKSNEQVFRKMFFFFFVILVSSS